jgi:hypothetical protein
MSDLEQPAKKRGSNALRVLVFVLAFALIAAILLFALDAILPGFLNVLEHGDSSAD